MKFHVLDKAGHKVEVSPLEYLHAPLCKRSKFMEALSRLREERDAQRSIRLHDELEETAATGLKLRVQHEE